METKKINLSIEDAREMYKGSNRLREIALSCYTREELENKQDFAAFKEQFKPGTLFTVDGDNESKFFLVNSYKIYCTGSSLLVDCYVFKPSFNAKFVIAFTTELRLYSETLNRCHIITEDEAYKLFTDEIESNIKGVDEDIERLNNKKNRYKEVLQTSNKAFFGELEGYIKEVKKNKR